MLAFLKFQNAESRSLLGHTEMGAHQRDQGKHLNAERLSFQVIFTLSAPQNQQSDPPQHGKLRLNAGLRNPPGC